MNHRVYRLPPCPSYDVEGMESWLSDQAEKGLFLCRDGFFAGIAAFDRTEPRSVRFRLEPASKAIGLLAEGGTEPDPEAKDLNEYYGWNYLASWGQFFIYFTDRQDARELNTDPAVQALALNLVRRRERGSFLSSVFWLLVYPLLLFYGGILQTMLSMGSWLFLWTTLLVLWGLFSSAASVFSLRKLHKKLSAGGFPDHQKNWKRHAARHRITVLLFAIQAAAWCCCILCYWKADIMEEGVQPLAEASGPYPFATLETLSGGGEFQQRENFKTNQVEQRSDWLAPVIIDYRQYGSGTTENGARFTGGLSVDYYETVSPWIARRLAGEFLSEARRSRHYSVLPLENPGVSWYAAYTDIFPTLLLQHGNRLIRISFFQTGESSVPIEEWAECFAEGFLSADFAGTSKILQIFSE